MKFLVDSNLPPLLVTWLENQGHEASHVDDVLPGSAQDSDIWALALQTRSIIITKDSDFSDRAKRQFGVPVLWVRSGNLKLGLFRRWFERRSQAAFALLEAGETIVEMN